VAGQVHVEGADGGSPEVERDGKGGTEGGLKAGADRVADVLETTIAGGEGRRLGARAEPAFVALLEIPAVVCESGEAMAADAWRRETEAQQS